ncbi:MAG: ComEC/Rec2 family competence protein, partial [Burkholderiaceae bacterium]
MVLLAQFSRYRMQVMDVLAIALLGVLMVDVRAVLAIGFWLSFAAVALIAFFLQPPKLALSGVDASAPKSAWWRAITSAVRIQFGLALGMIPLLLLFFGQVSWASPWANLLAVPVIGWIVVPLALIASALLLVLPTLGTWMLVWVERGLALLLDGLHWAAGLDWAMSGSQHWSLLASLLLLFALGLSVWAWRQRHRHSALVAGVLLLAALVGREPATLASNALLLRIYDLGRGYAVSVQSAEQVVLIDAGLRSGPHFDSGRDVLVPALHAAGIERIDRLWLTGERGDHQGGLPGVLQGFEVGEGVSAMDCAVDRSRWPLGKASEFWLESYATSDPAACVLELRGPQTRWLLTGAAPALGLVLPESLRVQDMASAWDGMIFSGHGKSAEQWPLWMAQVQPEQTILVRGRPRRYEAAWPDRP